MVGGLCGNQAPWLRHWSTEQRDTSYPVFDFCIGGKCVYELRPAVASLHAELTQQLNRACEIVAMHGSFYTSMPAPRLLKAFETMEEKCRESLRKVPVG